MREPRIGLTHLSDGRQASAHGSRSVGFAPRGRSSRRACNIFSREGSARCPAIKRAYGQTIESGHRGGSSKFMPTFSAAGRSCTADSRTPKWVFLDPPELVVSAQAILTGQISEKAQNPWRFLSYEKRRSQLASLRLSWRSATRRFEQLRTGNHDCQALSARNGDVQTVRAEQNIEITGHALGVGRSHGNQHDDASCPWNLSTVCSLAPAGRIDFR
jgi:hypothetical protein